jgi:hypothetical protein
MKHWPHVEVVTPEERLRGYGPPTTPSTLDELAAAAREAEAQGLSQLVLKAQYPRGYKPGGERRLVFPAVTGKEVGSNTQWRFVAVTCAALRAYVKHERSVSA